MRKLSFLILAALVMAAVTSCGPPPPPPVEDGVYLIGAATPYTEVTDNARMLPAKNEANGGTERASMHARYMPMQAGEFKLAVVIGGKTTEYGGTLFATRPGDSGYEQPTTETKYYTPVEGGTPITIAETGLYHVVYDSELKVIAVTKAIWGVRGAMNSWGFDAMTPSADFKTWTIDATLQTAGEFKFAYSGGWKLKISNLDGDNPWALADGDGSVRAYTNFGGSLSKLEEVNDNLPIARNIWTITLKFSDTGVPTATVVLKQSLESLDPATQVVSLIGSAIDGIATDWTQDLDLPYVSTDNGAGVYEASNVTFITGGEFKVRKDHAWDENWGYSASNILGDASNFEDSGTGNIKVIAGKTYSTVTFKMNWDSNVWSLTFTE